MTDQNNAERANELVEAGQQNFSEGEFLLAEKAFKEAINLGSVPAIYELGKLMDFCGEQEKALELFKRAGEAKHGLALLHLGILALENGEDPEEYLKGALLAGETRAMIFLGRYFVGIGEPVEARQWFNSALHAGEPEALFEIGSLIEDPEESRKWFMQSLEAGDRRAPNSLGLLEQELGNLVLAREWFQRGANEGDETSMFNLGSMAHEAGDLEEAKLWYSRSYDAGELGARTLLGLVAEELGNLEEARTWFRRAAIDGDAYAMHDLAELEAKLGNEEAAATWNRRAADWGYEPPKV